MWFIELIANNCVNDKKESRVIAWGQYDNEMMRVLINAYNSHADRNDYDELYDNHHLVQSEYTLLDAFSDYHEDVWVVYKVDCTQGLNNNIDYEELKPHSIWIMGEGEEED